MQIESLKSDSTIGPDSSSSINFNGLGQNSCNLRVQRQNKLDSGEKTRYIREPHLSSLEILGRLTRQISENFEDCAAALNTVLPNPFCRNELPGSHARHLQEQAEKELLRGNRQESAHLLSRELNFIGLTMTPGNNWARAARTGLDSLNAGASRAAVAFNMDCALLGLDGRSSARNSRYSHLSTDFWNSAREFPRLELTPVVPTSARAKCVEILGKKVPEALAKGECENAAELARKGLYLARKYVPGHDRYENIACKILYGIESKRATSDLMKRLDGIREEYRNLESSNSDSKTRTSVELESSELESSKSESSTNHSQVKLPEEYMLEDISDSHSHLQSHPHDHAHFARTQLSNEIEQSNNHNRQRLNQKNYQKHQNQNNNNRALSDFPELEKFEQKFRRNLLRLAERKVNSITARQNQDRSRSGSENDAKLLEKSSKANTNQARNTQLPTDTNFSNNPKLSKELNPSRDQSLSKNQDMSKNTTLSKEKEPNRARNSRFPENIASNGMLNPAIAERLRIDIGSMMEHEVRKLVRKGEIERARDIIEQIYLSFD